MVEKYTRAGDLVSKAKHFGLSVATGGGGGYRNYRFFKDDGREPNYYQGYELYTATGIREAEVWLNGYVEGKFIGETLGEQKMVRELEAGLHAAYLRGAKDGILGVAKLEG
jgi:hypothetical protein